MANPRVLMLLDRLPGQTLGTEDSFGLSFWTTKVWIYDFRTNEHFTLKDDFVACYSPENRHDRNETERFKPFAYEELIKRDKVSLDIFWLKDDSLEDSANLPDPDVIAAEITEDLQAALDQFALIAAELRK